jgi:hypothetical protein
VQAEVHLQQVQGRIRQEALKKKYLHKVKIKECALLASLSDLDHDYGNTTSSSSDEDTERWVKDKLNRLGFIATEAFTS